MESIVPNTGIAILIMSLGGILCIYFGYRIFLTGADRSFQMFSELTGWKLKVASIVPGAFFAILGALIICSPVITNIVLIFQNEQFMNAYATKLILDELRKRNDLIYDLTVKDEPDVPGIPQKSPSVAATRASTDEEKVTVVCDFLRLREKPGTHFPVTGLLQKGAVLAVKEKKGLWLRISTRDFPDGWVHGSYVQTVEAS
jgi:hypothetical protein